MSEKSYIRNLVVTVLEMAQQQGARAVSQVQITLSRASAAKLSEASLRENFELLTFDTAAQNAHLIIAMEAPQYKCLVCAKQFKTLFSRRSTNCPICYGAITEAGKLNSQPYTLNAVSFC